jgi:hypothetical protein
MFGVGLQVFRADRRLKNNSRWESHLVASGFRPFRSLRHRNFSLIQPPYSCLIGYRLWLVWLDLLLTFYMKSVILLLDVYKKR